MARVIPTDFIDVWFGFRAQGDPETCYTALGYEVETGGDVQDSVTLATSVVDVFQLNFKTAVATQWTMEDSFVVIGGATPPYFKFGIPGSEPGSGSTQSLPDNCAALFRKQAFLPGRQGKGRMYIPGLELGAAEVNGTWITGHDETWSVAMQDFLTDAIAIEGIVGPALFHDSASPVTTPSPIIAIELQPKIATQRRRMRP